MRNLVFTDATSMHWTLTSLANSYRFKSLSSSLSCWLQNKTVGTCTVGMCHEFIGESAISCWSLFSQSTLQKTSSSFPRAGNRKHYKQTTVYRSKGKRMYAFPWVWFQSTRAFVVTMQDLPLGKGSAWDRPRWTWGEARMAGAAGNAVYYRHSSTAHTSILKLVFLPAHCTVRTNHHWFLLFQEILMNCIGRFKPRWSYVWVR